MDDQCLCVLACIFRVVGTGVDPVTSRFSGRRTAKPLKRLDS
jgi:hypothetical protein